MWDFIRKIRQQVHIRAEELRGSGMLQGTNLLALQIAGGVMLMLALFAFALGVTGTGTETLPRDPASTDEETLSEGPGRGHSPVWQGVREILQEAHLRRQPALEEAAREYLAKKEEQERRRQELEARIEGREAYPDGEALWQLFSDAVIFGDSRTTGFSIYGFLPEKRVLAETSTNITAIDGLLERADEAAPARIYVSYGINDVATGLWKTPEEYAEEVLQYAQLLAGRYPDAQVCINSIFPASPDACRERPLWNVLPEYSAEMKRVCEEHDICYIDNSSLAASHYDLYAGDGIHFSTELYVLWAQNMLREADRYEAAHLLTVP